MKNVWSVLPSHYVPELLTLVKSLYAQLCHKINIQYFNISMEERLKLFPNSSLNDMEINLLKTIANNDGEYYIQSTSLDTNMIILMSLLKAMNKKSPNFINIILIPYTTSKDNFKSMLISHGFTVGDIDGNNEQICSIKKKSDVYIGSYQSDTNLNILLKDSMPGLLFLKDCHEIIQRDDFNSKIIKSSKEFNFNRFSRILMMSHIMNTDTAQRLHKVLRLNNEVKIRSIFNELPYKNRIQVKNMNYDDNNTEDEITNILIKLLSHSRGKSVVISDNKDKLNELYHNFKSLVSSDCSLLLFNDSIDETSIMSKFQNDPTKRVMITTEYEVSDFKIPDIQIVILYEYNPRIEIFLQILNFIKFKGMILIFDKNPTCRTSEIKKFYNITSKGHQNCCNHFIDDKFIKKLNQVITEPFSFGYIEDELETNKRGFLEGDASNELVDTTKRRKIEEIEEAKPPVFNSNNEIDEHDSSKSLIDKAGSFSSIEITPVKKNNPSESLNKNSNFNKLNLLETYTNDEVELHFRNSLPKDFSYFHTTSLTDMNKILDEDIGDVRNSLVGVENLYGKFPILREINSAKYKLYDYLLIEHVFKDPMFICCFAELVHLTDIVPNEYTILFLCADFIMSIFEKRDLGGMKGRLTQVNSKTSENACGYLKEFKMLSINLIKYYKLKIDNPKSDGKWRRFYKRHYKKLRSYGWANNYKKNYLFIKTFVRDPIPRTPLYLPNGTCKDCFGSCESFVYKKIPNAAKLTVFKLYMDGVELKGVPEELEQLKNSKLFSIYLILCLIPGDGYRALCHGLV